MDIATIPAFETIRTAVVTDKGEAVRHLYHLVAALRALPADDRADVLALLAEEAADQPA